MLLTDFPELCLQHDAPLELLRVGWNGKGLDRFREGSLHLVETALRLQPQRYVFDMNSLPDMLIQDQLWMGLHWLPLLRPLPVKQVVFVIGSHRAYHLAAIEGLLFLARPFIKFDVQFFGDDEAALRWITDRSPRLPALLAEWNAAYGPPPTVLLGAAAPLTGHR